MVNKKRVVVFGIFDGVHEGHRDFFRQALRAASGQAKEVELIVIVGRDEICQKLKNKTPKHSQEQRVQLVSQEPLVGKALLGDQDLSSYQVLENLQPDVICFGYDQDALSKDLREWVKKKKRNIQLVRLKKFDRS